MTFEKDFPSFVMKEIELLENSVPLDETMLMAYERKDKARYKAMRLTCLDKQRVKEAIDKVIPEDPKCATNMILNNELKKELGLE